MIVILNIKTTGSAEIVVTAGSSSDPNFIIANILGMTIADVLKKLFRRGYTIRFVSDHLIICMKPNPKSKKIKCQMKTK